MLTDEFYQALFPFELKPRPPDARENHCIHGPENCRECAAITVPKGREQYGDLVEKPAPQSPPEALKCAQEAIAGLAADQPKEPVKTDRDGHSLHQRVKGRYGHRPLDAYDNPGAFLQADAETVVLEAEMRRLKKDLQVQIAEVTQAMPVGSEERKDVPLATGVLDYFPSALMAVAQLSKAGNDKHNPGEPLHHSRAKSSDHADCILRHLADRGLVDPEDGIRHSVKVAWRALALCQEELEAEGAPKARGAK